MLLGTSTTSAIDFSGVNLPFNVADLLESANGLIGMVGPFVLLGIAIAFAPRVINFIKSAVAKRGKA